jgi:hypothetical protein
VCEPHELHGDGTVGPFRFPHVPPPLLLAPASLGAGPTFAPHTSLRGTQAFT